jgi:Flp pilus assembly protein TadD
MLHKTNIELEPAKSLTTRQEISVIRMAYARSGAPTMRRRLASLLTFDDELVAVTELLDGQSDLSLSEQILLAQAFLTFETQAGDIGALAAAEGALALAGDDMSRAAALALRGKAEVRLGRVEDAQATFDEALDADPHNKDACKRLAALALAAGDHAAVLSLYERLAAKGAGHSRLFAARALAQARSGDLDGARTTMGADRLFSASTLEPPSGWDNIGQFNAAVAEELLNHPELRYERIGSASELTWRVDSLISPAAPLTRLLLESIAQAIGTHIERTTVSDHPWSAGRPSQAMLRSWSVITESDGFENWHVHQFGWLSGAYYVQVPQSIAQGTDEAGCIAFGLPSDLAGEEAAAAYDARIVRPQNGLLLLFPSHTYHRTYPHGGRARRICVAFDVKPQL